MKITLNIGIMVLMMVGASFGQTTYTARIHNNTGVGTDDWRVWEACHTVNCVAQCTWVSRGSGQWIPAGSWVQVSFSTFQDPNQFWRGWELRRNNSDRLSGVLLDSTCSPNTLVHLYLYVAPPPPPEKHLGFCWTNRTAVTQTYHIYKGVGGGPLLKVTLAPGEYHCSQFTAVPPAEPESVHVVRYAYNEAGELSDPRFEFSFDAGAWGDVPGTWNQFADNVTKELLYHLGNTQIEFPTGNVEPATDETLRQGFSAIYSASSQAAESHQQELRAIANRLNAAKSSIDVGFLNLDGKMVAVQEVLDSLYGGQTISNQRLQEANTKLQAIDANLMLVRDSNSQIVNLISTSNGRLLSMEGFLLESRDALHDILEEVEAVNSGKLPELNTSVQAVKAAVEVIAPKVEEVGDQVEASGNQVAAAVQAGTSNIVQVLEQAKEPPPPEDPANYQLPAGASNAVWQGFSEMEGTLDLNASGMAPPPPDSSWQISFSTLGTNFTLDLNPQSHPQVASLMSAIKAGLSWTSLFALAAGVLTVFSAHLRSALNSPQGRSAGTAIMGTNANTGVALAMALLIVGAVVLWLGWFFTWWGANIGLHLVQGMSWLQNSAPGVSHALQLLWMIFPVEAMVSHAALYMVFRVAVMKGHVILALAIRMKVG